MRVWKAEVMTGKKAERGEGAVFATCAECVEWMVDYVGVEEVIIREYEISYVWGDWSIRPID